MNTISFLIAKPSQSSLLQCYIQQTQNYHKKSIFSSIIICENSHNRKGIFLYRRNHFNVNGNREELFI